MTLRAALLATCVAAALPLRTAAEVGPAARWDPPPSTSPFVRGMLGLAVVHNWDGAGIGVPFGVLAGVRAGAVALGVGATLTPGYSLDGELVAAAGISAAQGRQKAGSTTVLLLGGLHHASLVDHASGQTPGAVWLPVGGVRIAVEGFEPRRTWAGGLYLQVERDLASKRTAAGETWRATMISAGFSFGAGG